MLLDIDKLFKDYSNYLLYISKWYGREYRFIEADDLFSYLSLQFVESCKRFDPTKLSSFDDYIRFTMQKRAIDYLRHQIWKKKAEFPSEDLADEKSLLDFEDGIIDGVIVRELLAELRQRSVDDADFIYDIIFLDKKFSDNDLLEKYHISNRAACFRRYKRILKKLKAMYYEKNER